MRDGWERGGVSGWDLARGGFAYLQYKLGALDIQAWTVEMLRGLDGQLESEMVDEGRDLYERRMASVRISK